jgi:hypothetical protein
MTIDHDHDGDYDACNPMDDTTQWLPHPTPKKKSSSQNAHDDDVVVLGCCFFADSLDHFFLTSYHFLYHGCVC